MTRRLFVEITAGATTCAETPGVFCNFFRSRIDGSKPTCVLWDKPLVDKDGWLQRCDQCMEAEVAPENTTPTKDTLCPERDTQCDPKCTVWSSGDRRCRTLKYNSEKRRRP